MAKTTVSLASGRIYASIRSANDEIAGVYRQIMIVLMPHHAPPIVKLMLTEG